MGTTLSRLSFRNTMNHNCVIFAPSVVSERMLKIIFSPTRHTSRLVSQFYMYTPDLHCSPTIALTFAQLLYLFSDKKQEIRRKNYDFEPMVFL